MSLPKYQCIPEFMFFFFLIAPASGWRPPSEFKSGTKWCSSIPEPITFYPPPGHQHWIKKERKKPMDVCSWNLFFYTMCTLMNWCKLGLIPWIQQRANSHLILESYVVCFIFLVPRVATTASTPTKRFQTLFKGSTTNHCAQFEAKRVRNRAVLSLSRGISIRLQG